MTPRTAGWLKKVLRPKIFIPVLLAIALLAFAFSISDLGRVWEYLREIAWLSVVEGFALALVYLFFKGFQFKLLLERIGIPIHWRKLILAFAVGEMTLQIPAGIYAQNYVLKRTENDSFFWSSAATTSTLVIEVTLSLITLLILGIPAWPWLRPVTGGLLVLAPVFVVIFFRSEWVKNMLHTDRSGLLGKAARGFEQLFRGVRMLIGDPILLLALLLAGCYLTALVTAFDVTASGLGFGDLDVRQAASIYFFSLTVTLFMGGLLPQLGLIEVAGLGAAKAWGYSFTQGLAMLLAFRIIWMGSVWLICGPTIWLLRKELTESGRDDPEKSGD